MFGKFFSTLVAVLVVCCPLICGGAPLPHHHGDAAPHGQLPCESHEANALDSCFCSGSSVPTGGPTVDLSAGVAVWIAPLEIAEIAAPAGRALAAAERPPRLPDSELSLPLLI